MGKPTLAIVSTTGCTGCVVSFLDLHEDLIDVLNKVDLLYCTTILDVKEMPECDIALIDGTVANKHDIEILKEAESKARTIVTLGSCACFGGITGLRNFSKREEVIDYSYKTVLTNDSEVVPSEVVPKLTYNVDLVENIIKVDYKIPGCPPVPTMIRDVLLDLLDGKEPKAPMSNLCEECPRTHEKMLVPTKEFLTFKVNAPYETDYREDLCFLEQGILCIGFATREGCGGRCVKANLPCRGCMGPLEKEVDQGCASICGLASIFPIGQLINQEDLAGTVYRYSLPYSILHRVQEKSGGKKDE